MWPELISGIVQIILAVITLAGIWIVNIGVKQVHTLTNRNFSEQKEKIERLESIIKRLETRNALGELNAREGPVVNE